MRPLFQNKHYLSVVSSSFLTMTSNAFDKQYVSGSLSGSTDADSYAFSARLENA